MVTHDAAERLAATWQALREVAEIKTRETPVLARWFQQRVLRHPDLTAAIRDLLAVELADDVVSIEALNDIFRDVMAKHPELLHAAVRDLNAFATRDPSCEDVLSALLNYKGFRALQCHRVAHIFWTEKERTLARYLHSRSSLVYSVDIHPGARLGTGIFIDHGTAVVIGETAIIDDDVSMLHSVTLGGTGKTWGDRHPKIHAGVMIGAGATVLGNVEIGEGSKIAAGSVVLNAVPAHVTVAGVPARVVGFPRVRQPSLEMAQDIEEDG